MSSRKTQERDNSGENCYWSMLSSTSEGGRDEYWQSLFHHNWYYRGRIIHDSLPVLRTLPPTCSQLPSSHRHHLCADIICVLEQCGQKSL